MDKRTRACTKNKMGQSKIFWMILGMGIIIILIVLLFVFSSRGGTIMKNFITSIFG